jgi:hypothetical protein
MTQVMRDEGQPMNLRLDAAKSAAPFIHPRLSAIEMTGKDGGAIETKTELTLDVARRLAFMLSLARRGGA